MLPEEEFFDAVDATLDKLDKEEEKVCWMLQCNGHNHWKELNYFLTFRYYICAIFVIIIAISSH